MGQFSKAVTYGAVCTMLASPPLVSQTSPASAVARYEGNGGVVVPVTDADRGAVQPAACLEDALRGAFASAGVIFAGEVISIDREAAAVIVRWRVEDAVRGVTAGAVYEQKEWPGLWADGNARYRVGQRALVLLHAASVAGYVSPVADGIIPLHGSAVSGSLDLRWLAQQVAVTDEARLQPMLALRASGGDFLLSDASLSRTAHATGVAAAYRLHRLPSTGDGSSAGAITLQVPAPTNAAPDDANARVDGSMILGMLHAWQRDGTGSR